MFKLLQEPVIVKEWPVMVKIPRGPDKTDEFPIKVSYKVPSEYIDDFKLAEAVVDWEGVHDAAGNPLECTPDNVKLAMKNRWLAQAVGNGFSEIAQGGFQVKN